MKKLSRMEKWIVKEVLRQYQRFEDVLGEFYPDDAVVDFKFPAVDDKAYDFLYESREIFTDEEDQERRKRIENRILQVYQNVLEGAYRLAICSN